MKTFSYTLTDPMGLHARPAGMLVREAKKYASAITLSAAGKSVSAARLMALMSTGWKGGETVTVTVEGADEAAAAEGMEAFCRENL